MKKPKEKRTWFEQEGWRIGIMKEELFHVLGLLNMLCYAFGDLDALKLIHAEKGTWLFVSEGHRKVFNTLRQLEALEEAIRKEELERSIAER